MKLYSLLKNIKCRVVGNLNLEIKSLTHKDIDVAKDSLFFCLNGSKSNGENYAKNAIMRGAVAIVTERELVGVSVTQVIVSNARHAMSIIAAAFYGNPAKSLKLVGVTGTNGKTSITYILKSMFESLGKKCAAIGTNGVIFDDNIIQTGMTTPDPIELHEILKMLNKKGITNIFIEVSAHALDLNKLDGIVFDAMIFTNLTEDHLDYFGTLETYFGAKQKAFLQNRTRLSILNIDDPFGKRLFSGIKTKVLTYSTCDESMLRARCIQLKNNLQIFEINGEKFTSKLLGKFNVSNILSAICYMQSLGFNLKTISKLVSKIEPIPGRFNSFDVNGKTFIVDYAHTPDGLTNVLNLCSQLKEKDKKLICVFGCGGNRETQKRKIMGEISSKIADFVVITTDNPRFESREAIADDIVSGITNSNYKVILDRREAIVFANKMAGVGDVVLVAGKGEEDYIDELGKKTHYSDKEEILKLRNNND